ncbi:hypothetical protein KCQ59_13830 [Bacillus australimaris]|uniref:Uncharacterized protein n=1 Tax=Bacillus australimaris TaxID=1326968 RepID=A0ABD4QKI0_9BACI|nr:hypothetical protein [Bacillus australimaris]MBR8690871.1 hypothetical protein [Bacillus australimaris]
MFWGKKSKVYAVTSLCVKMNVLTEAQKKEILAKTNQETKKRGALK